LRLVIARVAFRPLMNTQTGYFAKMVAPKIWAQSEICAQACKVLAGPLRADPFLAFLAGLIQNVGMIVAFRLIDRAYQGKIMPDSDHFCHAFYRLSRSISARISQQWEFPEQVGQALEHLSRGEWDSRHLSEVLFISDQIGKLRLLIDHHIIEEDEYFTTNGMSPAALDCLHALGKKDTA
jgi:HDOD domain